MFILCICEHRNTHTCVSHVCICSLVNKREISASKKRGSGWDRSRVRGYFKKKSKRVIYFNAISMLFENYTSTHTCA